MHLREIRSGGLKPRHCSVKCNTRMGGRRTTYEERREARTSAYLTDSRSFLGRTALGLFLPHSRDSKKVSFECQFSQSISPCLGRPPVGGSARPSVGGLPGGRPRRCRRLRRRRDGRRSHRLSRRKTRQLGVGYDPDGKGREILV